MAFLLYEFLIIAFPFTLGLAVLFILLLLLLLFLLLSFLYYLHIKHKLKDADMFSFLLFCSSLGPIKFNVKQPSRNDKNQMTQILFWRSARNRLRQNIVITRKSITKRIAGFMVRDF